MKVLVTGASGFLGSYVVRELLAKKIHVRALCLPEDPAHTLTSLPIEVQRGDVLKPASLESACEGCDAVIHAAGLTSLRISKRRKLWKLHVEGTRNICTAAKAQSVPRLVYISSAAVLGAHKYPQPVSEAQPAPNAKILKNAYIRAKQAAEQVALATANQNFEVVSVLPCMLWGAGDWTGSSTGLISVLLNSTIVFYPKRSGSCVMDVADAAQGVVAALQKGKSGEQYILSGDNLSSYEFYEQLTVAVVPHKKPHALTFFSLTCFAWLAELLGMVGLDIKFSLDMLSYCGYYWWADAHKAEKELGFTRKHSFADTLQRTVAWYQERTRSQY